MLWPHFNLPLRSLSVKESHFVESRLVATALRASQIPRTRRLEGVPFADSSPFHLVATLAPINRICLD